MKTLVMDSSTPRPQPQPQPQDSSSSKRHFHWTNKVGNEDPQLLPTSETMSKIIEEDTNTKEEEEQEDDKAVPLPGPAATSQAAATKRKLQAVAISRLRSVLTVFSKNRSNLPFGLGSRVVGTLFGYRRGHVHFAFQKDPTSQPAFLIELATPISGLVREMASGLVRIALECDKDKDSEKKKTLRLLQESVWRTYCNGKKCGFATRRECGAKDWDILKAVEPISMGAGVLPNSDGADGEVMYMRARFERIVGSRDSEAFYMMNPDSNGAPELSIYLLRV
ncbi:protein MIZU-KUSSEI 1-like [Glycine soja]|uniref:Protein MIZU-KUSSEI 1 n=1 Tax=Glycine soja TaxID=3848 RepID=A0A445G5Y2_GLYSO|nr:protein MIZU-KUSSEI 1-like [Glycine soja]RZB56566.1 Protein MIZU-KUSSEI 1 [Glycine soja]